MPRRSLAARRIALAAVVLLCALVAVGCGEARDAGPVGQVEPASPTMPEAPADTLSMDEIRALSMPAAEKRQALPPEFPAQVPVIRGEVTGSDTEMGVVFYKLQVAQSQEQTGEWYRRMYVIANWTLVSQRTFDDPYGGQIHLLQFEKGAATSSISINEDGGGTVVKGTVTVGTDSSEV